MSQTNQIVTEIPRALSAHYVSDFAYPTVKNRMPIILTKVVDHLFRKKSQVQTEHGPEGLEDLKRIIGSYSQLKNEIQTNKPFKELTDSLADVTLWNACIREDNKIQAMEGATSSWFQSSWLLAECYFYRRIISSIRMSHHLKYIDPFSDQKQLSLTESIAAISALSSYLTSAIESNKVTDDSIKATFDKLFHVALWGNKCDLSISAGSENHQTTNVLNHLEHLSGSILRDDSSSVWQHLVSLGRRKNSVRVDIVLDNAGFELFTDLCLAEFLVSQTAVKSVHFHAKFIPWFVSDVTIEDWDWTLNQLEKSSDYPTLADLGKRWKKRVVHNEWSFKQHRFWTLPHDFTQMKTVAEDLYQDLAQSDLVLFKGDLNYRKITGDLKWPTTTSFDTSLQGFFPASLCCLRTLKSDVVVGLSPGQAEKIEEQNKDWMISGSFAVIQACLNNSIE